MSPWTVSEQVSTPKSDTFLFASYTSDPGHNRPRHMNNSRAIVAGWILLEYMTTAIKVRGDCGWAATFTVTLSNEPPDPHELQR